MDQLHLDLWWRGLNIAQDAGTYLYNAPAPWDNALVTTRVHNTVTVDGRDQMTRAGRFMVLDWVNAYSKNEIASDENVLQQVKATFKGYRLVWHERTVSVFRDERWVVKDQIRSMQNISLHTFRIQWLLPDWKWEIVEDPNEIDGYDLRLLSPQGWVTVRLWADYFFVKIHDERFSVGLARAGERLWGNAEVKTVDGWVSNTYGKKEPALSFSMTGASQDTADFTTEFIFPKGE